MHIIFINQLCVAFAVNVFHRHVGVKKSKLLSRCCHVGTCVYQISMCKVRPSSLATAP